MKPQLGFVEKSHLASLAVHAGLFATLYWIPASAERRFETHGRSQAITLEARWSEVAPPPTLELIEPLEPPESFADPGPARRTSRPHHPREPRSASAVKREASPRFPPPPSPPSPQWVGETEPQRRHAEQMPKRTERTEPLRKRPPRRLQPPAVLVQIPVPQPVGASPRETADLTGNAAPSYPLEAVRLRLEGRVLLELHISAAGQVDRVVVLRSSGQSMLDQAAVRAVLRWKGEPARRWGRAVESTERLPIRFRL